MIIRSPSRKSAGFSMLEVLIAVVVLSFGLLALAAVQSRIFQASAEAKAQSVGLALAKAKVEDLRSFMTMDQYRALVSGTDTATTPDGSGVTFTRSWTVRRYAVPVGATTFQQYGTVTGALPAAYAPNREFKTVEMVVTWTDASGQARSVRMEDAIAGLDPQDSARNQRSRTNRNRGPQVLIYNPAGEAGVIPIAIGNGSDTAATNPKPEVLGRNNSQAVVETRFDVLTYSGITGGNNALAQARVETAVVGCKCSTANAPPASAKAYRPVYWNGFRYVAPEVATYAPPAGAATIGNNDPPQSPYCTACCQNHHDPAGLASDAPRFDRRNSPHGHNNLVNGTLTPVTAGEYIESCRLIRTDGIFDVAADLSNDYFNLLETATQSTSPAPSAAGVSSYQNFVTSYLAARYVAGSDVTYNNRTTPAPATYAAAAIPQSLDVPAQIGIGRTNDTRWMHARGLYVDYLEKEARDAIVDAKSQCVDQSSTGLLSCVLRVLPFTSINLTELARWTTSSAVQLNVTNNDFITALTENNPIRGKATPGSNPQNGDQPIATSSITASNSGVALFPAIDTEDAVALTDTQGFRIGGLAPPPGTGGAFTVTLNGALPTILGGGRLPGVAFTTLYEVGRTCNAVATGTAGFPNPYSCSAQSLTGVVTVAVTNYNFQGQTSFSGSVDCTRTQGANTSIVPVLISRADRPVCRNFLVSAVSGGGLVGAPVNTGRSNETTPITFTAVADGDALFVTFTDETAALPDSPASSEYVCSANGRAPTPSDFSWNSCP